MPVSPDPVNTVDDTTPDRRAPTGGSTVPGRNTPTGGSTPTATGPGTSRRGALLAPATIAAVTFLACAIMTTTGGATSRAGYPASPPPAHTGGFGEPTCHACHFEAPLNEPGGSLTLHGTPDSSGAIASGTATSAPNTFTSYAPGETYTLTVTLARAEMANAGFQLAVRYADGPKTGAQAGTLRPIDDRSEVVIDDDTGIQYLHHTEPGSALTAPDTAQWHFEWTAPTSESATAELGTIIFHLAANAADADSSPFGDIIYTTTHPLPPPLTGRPRVY